MSATRPARILLVDDDRTFRISTTALLSQDGHEVVAVVGGHQALEATRESRFDLVLLDLRMPDVDGHRLVELLRTAGASMPIVMLSGFGSVEAAVQAMQLGADDFLTKPVEPALLSSRVAELLERRPTELGDALGGMFGRSPEMREVFAAIRRVAPIDTTVLITGETGTGKELVARALHEGSPRGSNLFLPVNCAALTEGLLESELFGHVRGAFTGAVQDKLGLFEAADGGTLFMDEIGDITAALQQRLLRALQEREVRRVGAVHATRVDVRIIAATSRDLMREVEAGRFRQDLFYRLNVFPILLPPLRERDGDIPLLIQVALERERRRWPAKPALACSPLTLRILRAYSWPGNVRQLFAAIETAAIRGDGDTIEPQHLPREVLSGLADDLEEARYGGAAVGEDERESIVAALEEAGGSRIRAAEILGMGRTTLWRKIKQYQIGEADTGS